MEMQEPTGEAERRGVPTFAVEAVVALILLALGGLVVVTSAKLGAGWTSDGPGSGYFPFYIGIILCISSAVTAYQALLGKKRNTDIFVDQEQLKRVLGLYVASAIYVAAFMVVLGKFSYVKSIVIAVVMAVLLFLMFEVWFKVPLFKGALNPLGFLGY